VFFSTRSTNVVSFRYTSLNCLRIVSGISPFYLFERSDLWPGTMQYPEPVFSFRVFSQISTLSIKQSRRLIIRLCCPAVPAVSQWTAVSNLLSARSSSNERNFLRNILTKNSVSLGCSSRSLSPSNSQITKFHFLLHISSLHLSGCVFYNLLFKFGI